MSLNVAECNTEHDTRSSVYVGGTRFKFYDLEEHNYVYHLGGFGVDRQAMCLFLLRAILNLVYDMICYIC
jgi:hypothetical protein